MPLIDQIPHLTRYPFNLIGAFEPSHMQYELDRINTTMGDINEPSIAEMVEKSIKILSKSANGYFLFVEGKYRTYSSARSLLCDVSNV